MRYSFGDAHYTDKTPVEGLSTEKHPTGRLEEKIYEILKEVTQQEIFTYEEDIRIRSKARQKLLTLMREYGEKLIGEDENDMPEDITNQQRPYLREEQLYKNKLRASQRSKNNELTQGGGR